MGIFVQLVAKQTCQQLHYGLTDLCSNHFTDSFVLPRLQASSQASLRFCLRAKLISSTRQQPCMSLNILHQVCECLCMQHVEEGYEGHGCWGGGCSIAPVCGPPASSAGAGQCHWPAQCELCMVHALMWLLHPLKKRGATLENGVWGGRGDSSLHAVHVAIDVVLCPLIVDASLCWFSHLCVHATIFACQQLLCACNFFPLSHDPSLSRLLAYVCPFVLYFSNHSLVDLLAQYARLL